MGAYRIVSLLVSLGVGTPAFAESPFAEREARNARQHEVNQRYFMEREERNARQHEVNQRYYQFAPRSSPEIEGTRVIIPGSAGWDSVNRRWHTHYQNAPHSFPSYSYPAIVAPGASLHGQDVAQVLDSPAEGSSEVSDEGWLPLDGNVVSVDGHRVPKGATAFRFLRGGAIEFNSPYRIIMDEWSKTATAFVGKWYKAEQERVAAARGEFEKFRLEEFRAIAKLSSPAIALEAKELLQAEEKRRSVILESAARHLEEEKKSRAESISRYRLKGLAEGAGRNAEHKKEALALYEEWEKTSKEIEAKWARFTETKSKYASLGATLELQAALDRWSERQAKVLEKWRDETLSTFVKEGEAADELFAATERKAIGQLEMVRLRSVIEKFFDAELSRRQEFRQWARTKILEAYQERVSFLSESRAQLLRASLRGESPAKEALPELDAGTLELTQRELFAAMGREKKATSGRYLMAAELPKHQAFVESAVAIEKEVDDELSRFQSALAKARSSESELREWEKSERRIIESIQSELIRRRALSELEAEVPFRRSWWTSFVKLADDETLRHRNLADNILLWRWREYLEDLKLDEQGLRERFSALVAARGQSIERVSALVNREKARRGEVYFTAEKWRLAEKDFGKLLAACEEASRVSRQAEDEMRAASRVREEGKKAWLETENAEVAKVKYARVQRVLQEHVARESERRNTELSEVSEAILAEIPLRRSHENNRLDEIFKAVRSGMSEVEATARDAVIMKSESERREAFRLRWVALEQKAARSAAKYVPVTQYAHQEMAKYPIAEALPTTCSEFRYFIHLNEERSLAYRQADGTWGTLATKVGGVEAMACEKSSMALVAKHLVFPATAGVELKEGSNLRPEAGARERERAFLAVFAEGKLVFLLEPYEGLMAAHLEVTADRERFALWLREKERPFKDFLHEIKIDGSAFDSLRWREPAARGFVPGRAP